MPLDKNDLKQIEKILDKRFDRVDKKLNYLDHKIEDEVGSLALMTVKEFARINKRLDKNDSDHEMFKKDFIDIRFRMSELVHKDEFFLLAERVERLENQLQAIKSK